MKKKVLYLLVILALAVVLPFFIKGKNGKPLMSIDHFSAPKVALPDLTNLETKARDTLSAAREEAKTVQNKLSQALPQKETKIYKWKDAEGKWHFSDQPRRDGESVEVKINAAVNTLPTVKNTPKVQTTVKDESSAPGLSLTTVPLAQVPQLIEDAAVVKDVLNARYQEFDEEGNPVKE